MWAYRWKISSIKYRGLAWRKIIVTGKIRSCFHASPSSRDFAWSLPTLLTRAQITLICSLNAHFSNHFPTNEISIFLSTFNLNFNISDNKAWLSVIISDEFRPIFVTDIRFARSPQTSANLTFYPRGEPVPVSVVAYISETDGRIRGREIESHSGVVADIVVPIVFSMFAYPIPFCVLVHVATLLLSIYSSSACNIFLPISLFSPIWTIFDPISQSLGHLPRKIYETVPLLSLSLSRKRLRDAFKMWATASGFSHSCSKEIGYAIDFTINRNVRLYSENSLESCLFRIWIY